MSLSNFWHFPVFVPEISFEDSAFDKRWLYANFNSNIVLHDNKLFVIVHFLCYYCCVELELSDYIEQNFGIPVLVSPLRPVESTNLPLYLKNNFSLFGGSIEGKPIIWARVYHELEATPERLKKQGQQIKEIFHAPVVFVFEHIDAYQRKRFIEKRIAFVQPNKQMYIPEMLLELSNVAMRERKSTKVEKLSYPAQYALLYHLQRMPLESIAFQEIAELLNYSAMTITRVVKEFDAAELVNVSGGKEKSLRFKEKGRNLWDMALPFLSSPIKETWFCNRLISEEKVLMGSDFALSEYTMLSHAEPITFVIGKEKFKVLREKKKMLELDKQYGDYKIEEWHYNPELLIEPDSKAVDKLSLYLSMQTEYDERVVAALEELLKTIEW